MSTPGLSDVSELHRTFGALFIGYVFAMIGYGFTYFQSYVYFSTHFKTDHRRVGYIVAALFCLDTISSGFLSHAVYHYLIILYPTESKLETFVKSLTVEIGISTVTVFLVHVLYSNWLCRSGRTPLGILIAAMAGAALGLGMYMTVIIARNPTFPSLDTPSTKSIIISSQGMTLLMSLVMMVFLCSHPPFMASRFDDLTGYTFSCGALAVAVQAVFLISYVVNPTGVIWVPLHLVASKTFINSSLSLLNSREVPLDHGTETLQSSIGFRAQSQAYLSFVPPQQAIQISVSRTTSINEDPRPDARSDMSKT